MKAKDARAEVKRLLEVSGTEYDTDFAARCIARAQVWATLAVSLQMAETARLTGPTARDEETP